MASHLKPCYPPSKPQCREPGLASLSAKGLSEWPTSVFAGAKPRHHRAVSCPLMDFFLVHQGRFHQQPGMALPGQLIRDKASKPWSAVTMATWQFQALQATLLASAAVKNSDGEGPLLLLH